MGIIPKSFKYKKYIKGKIRTSIKNSKLIFGNFGIQAVEPGRLTPKQLEAARKIIKKLIKPFKGIVKVKARAFLPVTSKPLAVRMGRGKGKVSLNTCTVKRGSILFEINCNNSEAAIKAINQGRFRLPVNTLTIQKLKFN
jgi:large subunit ribosomal protein L16